MRSQDEQQAQAAEYYDRLSAVRDHGDREHWLAFFLSGVKAVRDPATDSARRVLPLRERSRAKITDGRGRAEANGQRVLESLAGTIVTRCGLDDAQMIEG